MATVKIRRQGGAAIMTIPSEVMRSLGLGVGAQLDESVVDGALNARPRTAPRRKRYTLDELLVGATPQVMRDRHRFVVITPRRINTLGVAMTVPVTTGGLASRATGLTVPISGHDTTGVAVCN